MNANASHRTTARLLDLLELLGSSPGNTLTDLSRMLTVPKSSLLPLLRTLESRNYITQDKAGLYRLGTKLLELSSALTAKMDLRQAAHPELVELTEKSGESTILVRLTSDRRAVVYIDKVECEHPIRAAASVGDTRSLHATSSGRLLLAYLPTELRDALINSIEMTRHTDRTITSREALRQNLDHIRAQGFCVNIDQAIKGHCAIAAPILDSHDEVVAACVLSAPKDRVLNTIPELTAQLLETASLISRRLGCLSGRMSAHSHA